MAYIASPAIHLSILLAFFFFFPFFLSDIFRVYVIILSKRKEAV